MRTPVLGSVAAVAHDVLVLVGAGAASAKKCPRPSHVTNVYVPGGRTRDSGVRGEAREKIGDELGSHP